MLTFCTCFFAVIISALLQCIENDIPVYLVVFFAVIISALLQDTRSESIIRKEGLFMKLLGMLLLVALLFSAVGFRKYVWFISIGYGSAVAAIGLALLFLCRGALSAGTILFSLLFVAYGCRLGGYLAYRELRSGSYNKAMKTEIKDGSIMPMIAKVGIWVSASLLYVFETCPVAFRLDNGKIAAWLVQQSENTIYVLVRAQNEAHACARLKAAWKDQDILYTSVGSRIRPVPGDLTCFWKRAALNGSSSAIHASCSSSMVWQPQPKPLPLA